MRTTPHWLLVAGLILLTTVAGCTAGPAGVPAPPPRPAGNIGAEVNASDETQSTFAIDIDTASYEYARRLLLEGGTRDPAAVRPEEFINAFRQDSPQPAGSGFTVSVDGARLPSTYQSTEDASRVDQLRLLRIGLQTRPEDPATRADAALTFVVDVSGSMAEPGRLDLVQDALHVLIDQLRPSDSVAIVAYDDHARVLREMTPARDRSTLHAAVSELAPGGSTNLEEGLVTGYRVARDGLVTGASNRVILLSDGLANVGSTSADPILTRIREAAAKQIALLGVGVGSEYGDALMERLADAGDGFVTYVSEREQARQLFVTKLPATISVRALDAKVQVTFDKSAVQGYRLIGYENRVLDNEDFRNDRVDGGEIGPGHSVTALYVVRLREGSRGTVAQVRVRWLDPASREPSERAASVTTVDLDGSFGGASARLRVDYAAAYVAEVLRHSSYAAAVRLGDLASIASTAFDQIEDPQIRELADLIRRVD